MTALVAVEVARPPGCQCGNALADARGNIVRVSTCRICTSAALQSLRGTEYAVAYVSGGDAGTAVLLKQRDFLSEATPLP